MNIAEYPERKRVDVDRFLDLVAPPSVTPLTTLHESMRYSLLAGGKRIRPILTIAVMEVIGPVGRIRCHGGRPQAPCKDQGILSLIPHTHQCLLSASRSWLVAGLLLPNLDYSTRKENSLL